MRAMGEIDLITEPSVLFSFFPFMIILYTFLYFCQRLFQKIFGSRPVVPCEYLQDYNYYSVNLGIPDVEEFWTGKSPEEKRLTSGLGTQSALAAN